MGALSGSDFEVFRRSLSALFCLKQNVTKQSFLCDCKKKVNGSYIKTENFGGGRPLRDGISLRKNRPENRKTFKKTRSSGICQIMLMFFFGP